MRKNRAKVRVINPDPKYGNKVAAKFINSIMLDGKKTIAEKIFYDAMERVKNTTKKDELELFLECIEKVKPSLEVRSRRVGGATYQVPMEVRNERREALSIRWIVGSARKRNERLMAEKLFKELMDVINDTGASLKKRSEIHKMADANKAFAHFRW